MDVEEIDSADRLTITGPGAVFRAVQGPIEEGRTMFQVPWLYL